MDVVVAGGHGKVALRLLGLLAAAGHRGRGLVRNPYHIPELEDAGAEAILCDMEAHGDLSPVVGEADALVFAASAGPGSGPERKRAVDFGTAVKLIEACRARRVPRYVMVSAIGAPAMAEEPGPMQPYFAAKAEAEAALERSGLDYTIVRPGGLTEEPGTGLVTAAPTLERGGQVSRDDVAAVLAAVLETPNTVGKAFDLLAGETPVEEAVRAL